MITRHSSNNQREGRPLRYIWPTPRDSYWQVKDLLHEEGIVRQLRKADQLSQEAHLFQKAIQVCKVMKRLRSLFGLTPIPTGKQSSPAVDTHTPIILTQGLLPIHRAFHQREGKLARFDFPLYSS